MSKILLNTPLVFVGIHNLAFMGGKSIVYTNSHNMLVMLKADTAINLVNKKPLTGNYVLNT